MKSLHSVLIKVFCLQFYQSHASLFLILFGLAAGFMRGEDHIALGSLLISSPLLVIVPVSVWFLYTLIVNKFNAGLLVMEENRFLFMYSFVDLKKQIYGIAVAVVIQLLPALLYGIFLIILAVGFGRFTEMMLVITALLLIISLETAQIYLWLKRFHEKRNPWLITTMINRSVAKPFSFFFPEWIARREATVLIGTKIFSLLLIYAATQLYKFDTYDIRLLAMAVVVAFAAQSTLVWNLHYFENQIMSLTRNMPIPFAKRVVRLLITLLVLLIPDSALVAGQFPLQLQAFDLLSVLALGWSVCVFFYGFLYRNAIVVDQLATRTFFFGLIMIVVILFKVPLAVISISLFVAGCWLLHRHYYSYEPKVTADGLDNISIENNRIH